jgi:hypothetical protein
MLNSALPRALQVNAALRESAIDQYNREYGMELKK